MGNITFKVCKVVTNSQEQNFKNYSVELDQVLTLKLDGENNHCSIKMKDGNSIEIKYFDSNIVL